MTGLERPSEATQALSGEAERSMVKLGAGDVVPDEPGARILIAGASTARSVGLSRLLERLGYDVAGPIPVGAAIDQCRAIEPRLVLLDAADRVTGSGDAVRLLRSHADTASLPIAIVLAGEDSGERVEAYDAGADDVLPASLDPAEFGLKIIALLRRISPRPPLRPGEDARESRVIAVHSLRGGSGATSLAVNLALGLRGLWRAPTILVDLTYSGGQAAFYLSTRGASSWAEAPLTDEYGIDAAELGIVVTRTRGIDLIASPDVPPAETMATARNLQSALDFVRANYDFVVLDLGHDLRFASQYALAHADDIIIPVSPDLASIRSALAVLGHLAANEMTAPTIHLVVNWTFERNGIPVSEIERHLGHRAELIIPFAPEIFLDAINGGTPILAHATLGPIGELLEDFAYRLSVGAEHASGGGAPWSPALLRTLQRLGEPLPAGPGEAPAHAISDRIRRWFSRSRGWRERTG